MERDRRKLRLEVDSLAVDSFDTEGVETARGTVEAHACTAGHTCKCPSALCTLPLTAVSCPQTGQCTFEC